jgi:hypothetical protein
MKSLEPTGAAAMMYRFHFADSEIGGVTAAERAVHIRFSAAAVVRVGEPWARPSSGYAQSVELVLSQARPLELNREWMGRVADGRVAIAGRWLAHLPLPFDAAGPVELELGLANGSRLAVSATGLACRFFAEPNFNEAMSC